MIAPSMATMLIVLTTDAVARRRAARRRAARGRAGELRPARHRRLDVHQRHGRPAGVRRRRIPPIRSRSPRPSPSCAATWPGRCRPTPRASPSGSPCGSAARRARTTRCSPRGRSPATPWSRPRCSGPTRTGAASRPPRATAAPTSTPRRSTSRSTGCCLCKGGCAAGDRSAADLSGPDVLVRGGAGAGQRGGGDPHHRPLPRLRRGEQCLLLVSTRPINGAAGKAAILADALPYLQRFHGRIVVIKYGGNAMIDDELKQAFAAGHGVPAARPVSSRSSCTAAGRRSARCWSGSGCRGSSAAGCASPPRRRSTSCGWCSSARSGGSWSG